MKKYDINDILGSARSTDYNRGEREELFIVTNSDGSSNLMYLAQSDAEGNFIAKMTSSEESNIQLQTAGNMTPDTASEELGRIFSVMGLDQIKAKDACSQVRVNKSGESPLFMSSQNLIRMGGDKSFSNMPALGINHIHINQNGAYSYEYTYIAPILVLVEDPQNGVLKYHPKDGMPTLISVDEWGPMSENLNINDKATPIFRHLVIQKNLTGREVLDLSQHLAGDCLSPSEQKFMQELTTTIEDQCGLSPVQTAVNRAYVNDNKVYLSKSIGVPVITPSLIARLKQVLAKIIEYVKNLFFPPSNNSLLKVGPAAQHPTPVAKPTEAIAAPNASLGNDQVEVKPDGPSPGK